MNAVYLCLKAPGFITLNKPMKRNWLQALAFKCSVYLVYRYSVEAAREEAVEAAEEERFPVGATCVECGKNVAVVGSVVACASCAQPLCGFHRVGRTSTCETCRKTYCKFCLDKIDKCLGCERVPQLTCCELTQMPCCDHECGGCEDYHYKRCRYETEEGW